MYHSFIKAIAALVLLSASLFSRAQEFDWAIGFGGHGDDFSRSTTVDLAGNVYLTGEAGGGTQIGSHTIENGGAYVVKLNEQGELQWAISYGNYEIYGVDLAVDNEQNIYIAGIHTRGFSYEGVEVDGGLQSRIYVMKLNNSGELIWLKSYGTISDTGRAYLNGISVDEEGHLYFAGHFQNSIQLGDSIYNVRGRESFDSDMLLVKLSREGEVLDVKNPGSLSDEYFYDIAVNSDGIYAVGNAFGSSIEFENYTYYPPSRELAIILKYTLEGNLEWIKSFDSGYYSEAYNIHLNAQGEAVVTGRWATDNYLVNHYLFVAKVDSDGNLINNQLIEHPESGNGYISGVFGRKRWSVTTNGLDTYLSAGLRSTTIGPLELSSNNRVAAIVKFNEVGYPQWISHSNGNGNESLLGISAKDQSIYVAGEFSSDPLYLGELSLNNNSGNNDKDVFLTKLIDTTPNQCPDLAQFQLSYAPSICMGDSTLVTIDYPYSTYTSWSLNGEAFASNKNAIFVSEEGLYTVEVNMNTRCPAGILQVQVNSAQNQSPDTDIVIYPNPDIGIEVGGNTCYGDTITLSTPYQEQYSYNWYSDNNVRFVSDSTSTTRVALHTGNQQVSFDLSVSDNETGCVSLETKQLNIGQKPSNYISTSSMVCQDAQVFLSTGKGTGFSYEWSFSESAYDISTSNNFASVFFSEPDDSTRIDLVVTESFGNCSNHTTRYIQVKNKPDIVLEQAHDSIYITTSNLAYINWFFNDVKMAAAVNKTSIPIESGKYYVEGTTNYGCVGQSDVLTVNLIPLSTMNSPLKIYPNPARDNLTIQSKCAPDKIRIVDLNGKNLAQYEHTRAIDIKNLKNGTYILLLEIGGEQYQIPFLKE